MNTIPNTLQLYACSCNTDSDVLLPLIPNEHELFSTSFIYLHGKLQNAVGFDICYMAIPKIDWPEWSDSTKHPVEYEAWEVLRLQQMNTLPLGVNKCHVTTDIASYEAISIIWLTGTRHHGLIIFEDDAKALSYAIGKMLAKASHL